LGTCQTGIPGTVVTKASFPQSFASVPNPPTTKRASLQRTNSVFDWHLPPEHTNGRTVILSAQCHIGPWSSSCNRMQGQSAYGVWRMAYGVCPVLVTTTENLKSQNLENLKRNATLKAPTACLQAARSVRRRRRRCRRRRTTRLALTSTTEGASSKMSHFYPPSDSVPVRVLTSPREGNSIRVLPRSFSSYQVH
jgi:hypothetical protein